MQNTLAKMPILRVLIPFIIGIIASTQLEIPIIIAISTSILGIVLHLLTHRFSSAIIKLSKSYLINIPLCFAFIGLGSLYYTIKAPNKLSYDLNENSIAIANIEKVTHKDTYTSLILNTTHILNSEQPNIKLTAWVENNDYSLREGDIISFIFKPQPIKNNGNPEEFDYASYMKNKGIIYQTFIKNKEYTKIGHSNNIFTYARATQNLLVDKLLSSSLNPNTKYFFITILLGENAFLDKDTRESFSHAGISHILALSGLHVCIIALIINSLLYPLDYFGNKRIRLILTLLAIIAFAFISGLSISVIRSTLMMGFVILAQILYRKNSSLNALFASALIILISSPTAIYDVGFQLSFLSVFLILILANKFILISPQKRLLHFCNSTLAVSIITAIGTMSLTAFYFNYISFIAIITNFIIIPILPIIIGSGIFYLIILLCGYESTIFSEIINSLYNLISLISSLGDNFYTNTYISTPMLIISLCALITLIIYILNKQKPLYLYIFSAFIILGLFLQYAETTNRKQSGYVIFHNYKSTIVLSYNNNIATLISADENINIKDFKQAHRKFLAKHNIDSISHTHITEDIHTTLENKTMAIISQNHITKLSRNPRIDIDILFVTKGFYGNIEDLLRCYNPNLIILSSNIYFEREEILINECQALNIPYHSISSHGAFHSSL